MRSGLRGLVCVTICLILASAAMAQGQGQGRGRGGFGGGGFMFGSAQLLGIEQVQKELKITDDQKAKLTALREEGGGRGNFGNNQNLSDEEREKARAERQKRMEEQNKKAEALLDAGQVARLKQISLQVRGGAALADEAVAKELALSDDQKAQVTTIGEESGKQMREMFGAAQGGDRDEIRKKMEELRKNTDEEYMAVLTDEQKAKFAAMKGAEFKLDPSALRGRGGPGGGGRRRGGNNT